MTVDFNVYAHAYQRNRSVHPGVIQALVDEVGPRPDIKVLEVGCGTANYLDALCRETGARGYGIDPAEKMLEASRRDSECAPLTLTVGSAESLPYSANTFQFLFSVDVIHHVGNRPGFFAEAFRVLTPGCQICTVTDSADDIANRTPLSSHFPETVFHELGRYPSIETLVTELTWAGFDAVRETHVTHDYELTNFAPYRERAFSALRLIDSSQVDAGVARLENDLASGPIQARSLYTLIWGTKPA